MLYVYVIVCCRRRRLRNFVVISRKRNKHVFEMLKKTKT